MIQGGITPWAHSRVNRRVDKLLLMQLIVAKNDSNSFVLKDAPPLASISASIVIQFKINIKIYGIAPDCV